LHLAAPPHCHDFSFVGCQRSLADDGQIGEIPSHPWLSIGFAEGKKLASVGDE
jgi:hypothetical protein